MRLLSLDLSAHPTAWTVDQGHVDDPGQKTLSAIHARDGFSCRFCGDDCQSRQELSYLDGDRRNHATGNLVTACLLCAAAQNPMRRHAWFEMLPIWLPEMGQRPLNLLVRGLHKARLASGLPPAAEASPSQDSAIARRLAASFMALAARAADLQDFTGLKTPGEFAAMFLRLDPISGRCPDALAGGLRFLHRGRHYENEVDIYPKLLAAERAALPPPQAA